MSAVNVLVADGAVHLISDAAVYDDSGVFQHAAPKAFGLPHLQCAVAFRGGALAPLLANTLAAARSYDELKGRISYYLNEGIDLVKQITRSAFGADFQLFVGGWGEEGPEAWTLLTRPDTETSLPAWTPLPIAEQALTPC